MYSHHLRGLGASSNPNCADPAYAAAYPDQCTGGAASGGGGFDWNSLIQTVLNDVTQIVKPGAPALHPLYTPTSSAVSSLFNNPVVVLGGAALLYLALKKR